MESNIVKPDASESLEIAKLIKDGWNSAYKGIISDEYLANMNIEVISESWRQAIDANRSNIYVYKENNQILGVIRFGKAEKFDSNDMGEVFVLYVKPEEKRKGIGSQLLRYAQNQLVENKYKKMIIWCLKGNIQGSNFYKKHGGEKIEERDFIVRGTKVREDGFLFDLK